MRQQTTYSEYFPFFRQEAERQGLKQSEFMHRSGMKKQAFTKYRNGQGITAPTMVKMMEGLKLTVEQFETQSGIPLAPEKKKELNHLFWAKKNPVLMEYLMTHPNVARLLKDQAQREN